MAKMNEMPDFVLCKIFSYFEPYELLDLEQVCTEWDELIYDHFWHGKKRINAADIGEHLNKERRKKNFVELIERMENVEELDWIGLKSTIDEQVLEVLFQMNYSKLVMNFAQLYLKNDGIAQLLAHSASPAGSIESTLLFESLDQLMAVFGALFNHSHELKFREIWIQKLPLHEPLRTAMEENWWMLSNVHSFSIVELKFEMEYLLFNLSLKSLPPCLFIKFLSLASAGSLSNDIVMNMFSDQLNPYLAEMSVMSHRPSEEPLSLKMKKFLELNSSKIIEIHSAILKRFGGTSASSLFNQLTALRRLHIDLSMANQSTSIDHDQLPYEFLFSRHVEHIDDLHIFNVDGMIDAYSDEIELWLRRLKNLKSLTIESGAIDESIWMRIFGQTHYPYLESIIVSIGEFSTSSAAGDDSSCDEYSFHSQLPLKRLNKVDMYSSTCSRAFWEVIHSKSLQELHLTLNLQRFDQKYIDSLGSLKRLRHLRINFEGDEEKADGGIKEHLVASLAQMKRLAFLEVDDFDHLLAIKSDDVCRILNDHERLSTCWINGVLGSALPLLECTQTMCAEQSRRFSGQFHVLLDYSGAYEEHVQQFATLFSHLRCSKSPHRLQATSEMVSVELSFNKKHIKNSAVRIPMIINIKSV